MFAKVTHLYPHTPLQGNYVIEVLKNSLVLLVGVLRAITKHQAADDVGHSVVYQCLGIERLAYEIKRKCG